ncbi:MAG: nucleotide exchange factor GrpE [Hyphomicrobiales bacterium]
MSDAGKKDDKSETEGPSPEEVAEALEPGNDNEPLDVNLDEIEKALGGSEDEPDPFAVLEKLQTENEDLKSQLLRLAADMDNLRKRADREKAEASKYAASGFARDVIAVADNMERAIAAVPEEERASNEALTNLLAGVEMTERELINVFKRNGIEKLQPKGERFDPNFHDAVFEIENPDVPAGTVLEVAQNGYRISDRVLRPAMVGVSKGGPKGGATPEAEKSDGKAAEEGKS